MNERGTLRVITPCDATIDPADADVSVTKSADLRSADALNSLCEPGDPRFVVVGKVSGAIDAAALRSAADAMLSQNCAGCWLPLAAPNVHLGDARLPGWLAVHVRGAGDLGLALLARNPGERLFSDAPDAVSDRLRNLAVCGRLADSPATDPVGDLGGEFDWPELTPRGPSPANRLLAQAIHDLNVPPGCRVESRTDWIAFKVGLLQACDDLDGSHTLASEVQGAGKHVAGDYWHAIMHRREPDYGNSKYWFRRVGRQPAFATVAAAATEILGELPPELAGAWSNRLKLPNDWDPFAFVDLAQEAGERGPAELQSAVRKIQWAEIVALLRQTFDDAFKDGAA